MQTNDRLETDPLLSREVQKPFVRGTRSDRLN